MTEDERRCRMEKALAWGGPSHRISDVVELVKERKAQYWQRGDGMIVTQLERFPLYTACHYWLIFGSLPECLSLDADISEWAVGEGATLCTATGRRGWGRASQSLGWRPHLHTFYKRLVP